MPLVCRAGVRWLQCGMGGEAPDDLSAEIARTERALQDALNELRGLVSRGRRDREAHDLIDRCNTLATRLTQACERLPQGDDEDATRAAARYLAAHLVILEREVEQAPLH
jgi:hypothetical protein